MTYNKYSGFDEYLFIDEFKGYESFSNVVERETQNGNIKAYRGHASGPCLLAPVPRNGKIKAYQGHDDMALEVRPSNPMEWCRNMALEVRPSNPVEWRRKSVRYQGREWMFFHYVVAKLSMFFTMPDWQVIPDTFFVNKYGFYKEGQSPIRFRDLFTNAFLFGQVRAAFRKKSKTIRRLICNMQVKAFINAIRKQF